MSADHVFCTVQASQLGELRAEEQGFLQGNNGERTKKQIIKIYNILDDDRWYDERKAGIKK